MRVANGELHLESMGRTRYQNVTADLAFSGDSIAVRRVSATTSSDEGNGSATISGWVTVTDRTDPHFDLYKSWQKVDHSGLAPAGGWPAVAPKNPGPK